MESCFPHAPPQLNLLAFLSSVMPPCYWLVVASEVLIGGRLRPQRNFLFLFFCCSFCWPKQSYGVCPTRSAQVVCPPQYPSYCEHQLLAGCCVVRPKDGHLRPRPSPSLWFLMGCVLVPQTKDRTAVTALPMHCTNNGPIGSSGAKRWVHGGCCHGERGPKPLKSRAVAAYVGCCVLWLYFVLWLVVEYCIIPIMQCRAPHPC
jgi:hypothetical protein